MTQTWDDIVAYRQQLAIIQERQRFMAVYHTYELIQKNDARLLDELRRLSPECLPPVMIWPDQDYPRVGYLIQRVGGGSHRVLVCLTDWKIIRVKASGRMWVLKEDEAFKRALTAQQDNDRAIAYILGKVHATPPNRANKEKKPRSRNGAKA